jgi:uncharacterized protein (TIGR00106 family)
MTVIGTLSVMPVGEGDATDEIAAAADVLDEHGVDYEINAMGTVIEAEDVGDLFAAARAAHEAVDAGRVHTVLRIDDDRDSTQDSAERVAAVEKALGREPTT